MAVPRKVPLTQVNGVAVGATASINLPLGVRYHSIHLQYTTTTAGGPTEANMVAEIGEIRVLLNGVVQRRMQMQDLFNINRTKGKSPVVGATNGYIDILFREPRRLTHAEREAASWGTLGLDTFQIEVDIINNAGQTPTLKGMAWIDDVQEPPQGIVKWTKETIQVAATGDVTYNLGPKNGESVQSLIFIEGTAGDITGLKINWDSVKIEDILSGFEADLDATSDFTVVAKLRHVHLDENNPANALPMVKKDSSGNWIKVQDFNAVLTMGAVRNVTLYRELVGRPF